VIGVSHDSIDTLDKFSVSECRSKFAVAADPDEKVIKSFDAVLMIHPEYSNRTSYVIAPDHTILMEYTDLSPGQACRHARWTAVKKWRAAHPQ
jgi:peroxiredoxin Q/BCP